MKSVLLAHARRYPKMEPTDAVKLLYQSEFGGGHLIRDTEACLNRLRQEYAATHQNPEMPLLEEISSGMVRVNLAALDDSGYSVEELGRAFIRSAAAHKGSMEAFREKLALLRELTLEEQMPFSSEALEEYLGEYKRAGFPAVSHSEAYHTAYHPAYRVVDQSCFENTM